MMHSNEREWLFGVNDGVLLCFGGCGVNAVVLRATHWKRLVNKHNTIHLLKLIMSLEKARQYVVDYDKKFSDSVSAALATWDRPMSDFVADMQGKWFRSWHHQMPKIWAVGTMGKGEAISHSDMENIVDSVGEYDWSPEQIRGLVGDCPLKSEIIQILMHMIQSRDQIIKPSESAGNEATLEWKSCSECGKIRVVRGRQSDTKFKCGDVDMDYSFIRQGRRVSTVLRGLDHLLALPCCVHPQLAEALRYSRTNLTQMMHNAPQENVKEAAAVRQRVRLWRGRAMDSLAQCNEGLWSVPDPRSPPPAKRKPSGSRQKLLQVMSDYRQGAHYEHDLHTKLSPMSLPAIHRLVNPTYKEVMGISAPWASDIVSLGRGYYILRDFINTNTVDTVMKKFEPLDTRNKRALQRRVDNALYENNMYDLWYSDCGGVLRKEIKMGRDLATTKASVGKVNPNVDVRALSSIWTRLSDSERVTTQRRNHDLLEHALSLNLMIGGKPDEMDTLVKRMGTHGIKMRDFLSELAVRRTALQKSASERGLDSSLPDPFTLELTLIANGLDLQKTLSFISRRTPHGVVPT